MSELLSPAGTTEAFHAAIANGCDAIYLGLDKFSARAYANNFTLESLKELLDFAHLRNIKIYITINTIIYDDELLDAYKTIDELAKMNVDGIIIQDLAVLEYIVSHYQSLAPHASTQMGVDDLDAATLLKQLGFKRIVFARETPLLVMKDIKEKLNIEIEAFIHGALCVSYSGNCYMSSSIGERSGNRGRCAGCCRKYYSLIDTDTGSTINNGFLLSMKDLNVSENIKDLSFVDSLKIEGRMKEPNYVASVTKIYRKLLDNEKCDLAELNKVFNRTYTKGFMNGANSSDITNIEKPNNYGYLIGSIIKQYKNSIWIKLNKPLAKGDQIRIETEDGRTEISVPVLKLFDNNFSEKTIENKIAVLTCEKKVKIGAKVYKTKDISFVENADRSLLNDEYKKLPINIEFIAHIGKPMFLKVMYNDIKVFDKSDCLVELALTQSTTEENVIRQLSKLNNTPYTINNINIEIDNGCFISLKEINELRRKSIEKLNSLRLSSKIISAIPRQITHQKHDLISPEITVEVSNEAQYKAAKELGIKTIYFDNVIRRNNANYKDINGEVLVNGYGGIYHYLKTNDIVTDSSLNVVNYKTAAILSNIGVKRITLSQEISKDYINSLVLNYFNEYKTYPNLELIVYGRNKIMHSKYCPLKRLGMCGDCKKAHFALRDEYADFPIIFNDDCTITLLNSKILNIMDDLKDLKGVNYYRLVFTLETPEEVKEIISAFKQKLEFNSKDQTFKASVHTRGHFIEKPL